jgi:hypothetical protein
LIFLIFLIFFLFSWDRLGFSALPERWIAQVKHGDWLDKNIDLLLGLLFPEDENDPGSDDGGAAAV